MIEVWVLLGIPNDSAAIQSKYNSPTLISSLDYCATEMRNSICTSDQVGGVAAGSNSDMIKLSNTRRRQHIERGYC